jgi:hypothetical protein
MIAFTSGSSTKADSIRGFSSNQSNIPLPHPKAGREIEVIPKC